jgi:hypothetical protein
LSDTEPNVTAWTLANAEFTGAEARRARLEKKITWGMFAASESSLGVLGDLGGLDVIELEPGPVEWAQRWPAEQIWLARKR